MEERQPEHYTVYCLAGDQAEHIRPVEAWFGERAEFVYDTDPAPVRMLEVSPDIVLCVNDFPYEIMRCLDAAHAAGIPSLVFQDGILEWRCQYENPTFGFGGGAPQHQPVIADKIACIGHQSARQIAAWGNAHKVEVTGMPRMDYLLDYEAPSPNRPGKRLLVMTAKKPGFTPDQVETTLRSLRNIKEYFDSRDDVEVVWRITKQLHLELGVQNQLQELASQDLVRVLAQVDAVITTPSTAMLEAMLLSRPVAALDYYNVPRFVPTAWTISAQEHIPTVVDELLTPSAAKLKFQEDCLQDCLWLEDRASARVGELIEKMVVAAHALRTSNSLFVLSPNLLDITAASISPAGKQCVDLSEVYPEQEIFEENDLQALQIRYARLNKEYEKLRNQLRTRDIGYWMSATGNHLARRIKRRSKRGIQ